MGHCTRYGALHPLWGAAPNQKGCNANRWGRTPIDNKRKCGLAACNNDLDSNVSRTRAAYSARGPPVPHAGRLSRTWAACPVHGRGCPDSEQQAHVRMRRPRLHIASLRALQRARCRAAPLLSHAGRLSRTRAACPVRGRGCPGSEQQAHVRMRRPHQSTQSTNPINTTRPITPHVDLLGWKAPLDLLGLRGLRGLRDPAGHQIDRFEPQARGALTAGRTAPGSRARQCRCVQPSHRPPSYHPAQPGAGALGPRRRGGQSRGSRATGG